MNYEKEEARPGNGRSRYADGERENVCIGNGAESYRKQDWQVL
jgi:hypothetical protein